MTDWIEKEVNECGSRLDSMGLLSGKVERELVLLTERLQEARRLAESEVVATIAERKRCHAICVEMFIAGTPEDDAARECATAILGGK